MRARPRRSTSTGWCATTTCANAPELGDLQLNLAPQGERSRASHEIALDLRRAPEGGRAARRGERSRSSRSRRVRPCWRRCWPRSTARTTRPAGPSPREVEEDLQLGALHRRRRQLHRRAASAAARLHRPGAARVLWRRAARRVRHPAALLGGVSVGYSHRGEERNPIEIAVRLPKRALSWSASLAVDAGAGQRAARQPHRGRAGRGRTRRQGSGLADDLPPRRARSRTW